MGRLGTRAAIVFAASLTALAHAAPLRVNLPTAAKEIAVTSAGSLVTIDGEDGVTLYPNIATGDITKPVTKKVGGKLTALAWKPVDKKAYVIVLSTADHALYVLDDKTLETVNSIPLGRGVSTLATPTQPQVPYVYVAHDRESLAAPERVDLVGFTSQGPIKNIEPDNDLIAVSADGAILYGRRSSTSPTGIRLYRLPAGGSPPVTAATIMDLHDSTGPYVPDAMGMYVASGPRLFTSTWKPVGGQLDAVPAAFFPDRPLVAALDRDELVFLSTNSFKRLGSVPLGAETVEPATPRGRGLSSRAVRTSQNGGGWNVVVDGPHNLAIACREDRVVVVPLAELNLPSEMFLAVTVEGSRDLTVGKPATLKVIRKDPKSTVEALPNQAGIKLTGDTLSWTPSPADIGTATVSLKVSGGGLEHTEEVALNVRRNSLPLPCVASMIRVAEDGKIAALLAQPAPERYGESATPARVLLVDLEKMAVVADRTLKGDIHLLAINDKNVYVAGRDSEAVYMLSRKDLSDVKRIFAKSPANSLVATSKRVYVGSKGYTPDMEPLPEPEPDSTMNSFGMEDRTLGPLAAAEGWYFRGMFFDSTMTRARLAVKPQGFPIIALPNARFDRFDNQGQSRISTWGGATVLSRLRGRSISRSNMSQPTLLAEIPAAACIEVSHPQRSGERVDFVHVTRTELTLFDLVTGQEAATLKLAEESSSGRRGNEEGQSSLVSAPGSLLALMGDRLYVVPLKEIKEVALSTPVYFEPEQSAFIVEAGKTATIAFKASGGKGGLTYAVVPDVQGVSVDASNGKVNIDSAALMDKATAAAMQMFNSGRFQKEPDPVAKVAKMLVSRYKDVTGETVQGVPVELPLGITAQDSEQKTAKMEFVVFIDVPLDVLTKAYADAKAKQAAPTPVTERPTTMPQTPAGGASEEALRQRISVLERQVQDLEAQNRMLKEMVTGKSAPGTQPAR